MKGNQAASQPLLAAMVMAALSAASQGNAVRSAEGVMGSGVKRGVVRVDRRLSRVDCCA